MENYNLYDVIILGSGPAGFTAGIYAVRAGLKTLILAGIRWGGQLMLTTKVENYPGFPDGIEGPTLMMNMRKQAERLGVEIINSDFEKGDFSKKPFTLFADGKEYQAKSVIITTGADSIWLNLPGELQLRGRGVSTCAVCDAFFFRGKDTLVVGGGDSAMEEALVLAKVAESVTIVHRRNEFRASYAMQKRVFEPPKIRIIWNAELVKYNGTDKLESINLKLKTQNSKLHLKTQNQDIAVTIEQFERETMKKFGGGKILEKTKDSILWRLPVNGVFVAIGHTPNTTKFAGIELDTKGYVVRKEVKDEDGLLKYRSTTSVRGVFTGGDVHDYNYRQAITAAGFGCIAALDVIRYLEENS